MSLKRLNPVTSRRCPQSGTAAAPVRVCIIGGGFGGLYCALDLHRRSHRASRPLHITLVEPRQRFNFTPLLYELITQELAPWEIAPAYRDLLAATAVDLRPDWADAIDLTQHQVSLRSGDILAYDYLVLALGSQMRPPAVAGSQAHSLPFCTPEDAHQLNQRLAELAHQPLVRIAVAGAGPSGVELACKLSDHLGARGQITLVDRRGEILRSYPPRIQRAAARALARRQVEVYTDAAIAAVDAHHLTFEHRGQEHRCPADLVLWTVGTVPRPWLGSDRPAATPFGQCQVRPTLQLLDHSNVFVLGDMAAMPAPGRGRAPTTAQAAYQAAPAVARNILALIDRRPLAPFVYHHLGDMLTLGRGEGVMCGMGLCFTGRLGGLCRRWAYWLRLPTPHHRWRVLRHWLSWRSRAGYAGVEAGQSRV